MNNTNTLLIWEEIPEDTTLYLLPSEVADKYLDLLTQAHNKFINFSDYNEGLAFLNAALCDEEHIDDNEYFEDENGISNKTPGIKAKKEWRCIFAKYKVDESLPLEANISRVILSGFAL